MDIVLYKCSRSIKYLEIVVGSAVIIVVFLCLGMIQRLFWFKQAINVVDILIMFEAVTLSCYLLVVSFYSIKINNI